MQKVLNSNSLRIMSFARNFPQITEIKLKTRSTRTSTLKISMQRVWKLQSTLKLCCTPFGRQQSSFPTVPFKMFLIDFVGYGALSNLTTPFYGSYLRFIQIAVKLGNDGDWWIGCNEFLFRSNDARERRWGEISLIIWNDQNIVEYVGLSAYLNEWEVSLQCNPQNNLLNKKHFWFSCNWFRDY